MYRIVEWEKWQSYRKGRGQPPWIKLHRRLLRNSKWIDLTDAERGQLIAMWILAADHHGEIDMPLEKIQRVCFMSGKINIKKFLDLGFICQDGANVAPTWRQSDAPETEVETEVETETETEEISCEAPEKPEPSREVALRILDFLNQKTGRSFRAYEGTNGKRKPTASMELVLSRLKAGATEEDMKGVIARKVRQWGGDAKMEKFLRPVTLFSRTNYDQYVGEQEGT